MQSSYSVLPFLFHDFHSSLRLIPYPGIPDERKLGDLIYTDWFQKKQISHWADDFHKTIYKKTARLIQEDPCMRSMLQAYCEDEHTTAMNLAHAAILKIRSSKSPAGR